MIGEQDSKPSLVVMSYAKRDPAMANEVSIADKIEKALPFDLAWVVDDDIVQKVSVQRNADGQGGIALCIHSTAAFAQNATTVLGKPPLPPELGGHQLHLKMNLTKLRPLLELSTICSVAIVASQNLPQRSHSIA